MTRRTMLLRPARKALRTAARGLALCLLSLGASLSLFIVTVLSLALLPLGVGFLTAPAVIALVRMHANQRRILAHDWTAVTVPAPYRPFPPVLRGGLAGQVERCTLLLRDPATWRDLLWLLVDAVAGFTVALLCALLCTALLPLGMVAGPPLLRVHFLLVRAMIAPTREARLEQRVRRLAETRHDAVDTSAAQLRRIERDLHDGAQARLVAMGMHLGTVEALIDKDPAQAKTLVAQARSSSAEALTELRDLVRGIHPPVLAERGLADAAEALALRCRVPVETDIDLPGRLEEPVETAAYFALSEVLTNAAKHSGAHRVWLDAHWASTDPGSGMLRVAVTDDGRGGADVDGGSGLRGVERRLGQFDGVLALSSPPGGPTMVTMEVPARLRDTAGSPSAPRR